MRLINITNFELESFVDGDNVPEYAILSHVWLDEEVTFEDWKLPDHRRTLKGFSKIEGACNLASRLYQLDFCWIDTFCIDKSSSAELTEAINSMYRYYRNAKVCMVYLADAKSYTGFSLPGDELCTVGHSNTLRTSDVGGSCFSSQTSIQTKVEARSRSLDEGKPHSARTGFDDSDELRDLCNSRWFTRGWTLQELIAPSRIEFFNASWEHIGALHGALKYHIAERTGIPSSVLAGDANLADWSIATRMSWASKRNTTRIEDEAYCLFGLFDVSLPLIYGEGRKAFMRLQEEIIRRSTDHSILVWNHAYPTHTQEDLLASSPADFAYALNNPVWEHSRLVSKRQSPCEAFELTNLGLKMCLPLFPCRTRKGRYHALLNCCFPDVGPVALNLSAPTYDLTSSWPSGVPKVLSSASIQTDLEAPGLECCALHVKRFAVMMSSEAEQARSQHFTITRHAQSQNWSAARYQYTGDLSLDRSVPAAIESRVLFMIDWERRYHCTPTRTDTEPVRSWHGLQGRETVWIPGPGVQFGAISFADIMASNVGFVFQSTHSQGRGTQGPSLRLAILAPCKIPLRDVLSVPNLMDNLQPIVHGGSYTYAIQDKTIELEVSVMSGRSAGRLLLWAVKAVISRQAYDGPIASEVAQFIPPNV